MARAVAAGITQAKNARAKIKKPLKPPPAISGIATPSSFAPRVFRLHVGRDERPFRQDIRRTEDDPRTRKKPYSIVISAGNDGSGAVRHIERICKGYNFKKVQNPIICKGPVTPDMLALCRELGETIAEGVNAGIF